MVLIVYGNEEEVEKKYEKNLGGVLSKQESHSSQTRPLIGESIHT